MPGGSSNETCRKLVDSDSQSLQLKNEDAINGG